VNSVQNLIAQDRKLLWHPYSAIGADLPIFPVKSAQGVRIKLLDGRELIDGMSSWWSAIHGYNHPSINQSLSEQLQSMAHVMFGGLTHQPAVDLATKLIEITPASVQTVFFADSGSVAVEVAIKMAIQYWYAKQQPEKNKLLTIRYGYHGDTFGAMSVTDPVNGMHSLFSDILSQQFFADAPKCDFSQSCTDQDIESLLSQLEKNHHSIAAIILEPIVQGAGGMRFYSPEYLRRVKELCDHFNVLLILDEIATGFGRTGKMFACEHEDVTPDMLVLGKGLTGGYLPLSATITTQEVYDAFLGDYEEFKTFFHGHSYAGNPVSCAASLGNLEAFENYNTLHELQDKVQFLEDELKEFGGLKHVGNVRNKGAMVGIELVQDKETKEPYAPELKMGWKVADHAMKDGVLLRPLGNVVVLMPPVGIPMEDLKKLVHVTYSSIKKATEDS